MSPRCSCGSHVSHSYARVARLNTEGKPVACPDCGNANGCTQGVKSGTEYDRKYWGGVI